MKKLTLLSLFALMAFQTNVKQQPPSKKIVFEVEQSEAVAILVKLQELQIKDGAVYFKLLEQYQRQISDSTKKK